MMAMPMPASPQNNSSMAIGMVMLFAFDMLLRAHNIRTVVPTGISTNVCVESTLRDAFEHTYYVCVPEDGCASWDMTLHAATLKTANARFGLVTSIDEIISIWKATGGARGGAEQE